jgi:hypothetical protein
MGPISRGEDLSFCEDNCGPAVITGLLSPPISAWASLRVKSSQDERDSYHGLSC